MKKIKGKTKIFSKKFFIVFLIFCFSVIIRISTLNQMGRTADEAFCTTVGYHVIQLIKKFDFSNPYWVSVADPPPLCHITYGFFSQFNVIGFTKTHEPIFSYNYLYPRLVSVFASSFSVALLALLGWEYISPFVGIVGAIIFSMIPQFLGLSQLVTQESLFILLYNANIYIFLKFISNPTRKKSFFLGMVFALALLDKLVNIFLLIIMLLIFIVWKFVRKKKIVFKKEYALLIVAGFILSFLIFWPSLFIFPKQIFEHTRSLRFGDLQPWEWFFGRPARVPLIYFPTQFLIRTPVLLLFFALLALELRPAKKNWSLLMLLAWFFTPFLLIFYIYQQQGVRYISEVYAPFSLLAALGIEDLVEVFSKKMVYKIIISALVILYLSYSLLKISPYYLDYFNEIVKGVKGVYKHQLFEIGWWGEGGKDAGDYVIAHAKPGNTVGYKIAPGLPIEQSSKLTYEPFKLGVKYDFIITNYYYYLKHDYNNPNLNDEQDELNQDYKLVHATTVDSVPLYKVYKHE